MRAPAGDLIAAFTCRRSAEDTSDTFGFLNMGNAERDWHYMTILKRYNRMTTYPRRLKDLARCQRGATIAGHCAVNASMINYRQRFIAEAGTQPPEVAAYFAAED